MVLKYPSDLSSRYYLALSFSAYTRPDPFTQAITLNPTSTICLPMPAELKNRLDLNWDSTAKLNAGVEAALDLGTSAGANWTAAQQLLTKIGPQFIGAAAADVAGVVSDKNMEGQLNKITNFVSGAMVAGTEDVLQRAGLALNPILTVMFKNPRFKVYSFSWRFAPDNLTDDQNLDAIIQIIDRNAKPSLVAGGAFFGYPSIASIQLVTPKSEYGLFQIQPCVITSFEVNYAPHGIPSFLAGTGHAAIIDIRLELLEIVLNTRDTPNSQPENALAAANDMTIGSVEQNIQNFASGINGLVGSAGQTAISAISTFSSLF